MDDIEATIRDVICEATGYEWANLKDSDNLLLDLGMDSLDFANLELEAEERLNITISSETLSEVKTVGDLMAKLRELADMG